MTAMFPSFYAKPNLLKLGLLREMSSHGELALYEYLIEMCDRRNSRQFTVVDKDVFKVTGISERTLIAARKKLQKKGLILYRLHLYTVCDPETRQPFPGDPKIVCRKDSPKPAPKKMPEAKAAAAETETTMRAEGVDLCDTDFPYGCNLVAQPAPESAGYNFDAVFAAN